MENRACTMFVAHLSILMGTEFRTEGKRPKNKQQLKGKKNKPFGDIHRPIKNCLHDYNYD